MIWVAEKTGREFRVDAQQLEGGHFGHADKTRLCPGLKYAGEAHGIESI